MGRPVPRVRGGVQDRRGGDPGASFPRYIAAARHLNTALSAHRGESGRDRWTLGDYVHGDLSEFSPGDLSLVASGRRGTVFSGYFGDALLPRVERMLSLIHI